MNILQQLEDLGQSIWYDNISRSLIQSGELKRLVDEGLLGVTSNPTIFDKAISGSADYDSQIRDLLRTSPTMPVAEVIRALMVRDIQMATDVFLQVYRRTNGRDGYISVEVTPNKARDTQATIEEVRLLWKLIGRPNLMIKIPATREGLPAIEQAIAEGININVTLIFSVQRYREVAEAYIRGIEKRASSGQAVRGVASVASVFVSRIDTLVDDLLQKKLASAGSNVSKIQSLMGKAAVANTKLVYAAFKEIFDSPAFAALQRQGASVQRPLWGSTGTKNPSYSDLLYVNTLIGRDTVNTVPPSTYKAIMHHGTPSPTIGADLEKARAVLVDLRSLGVDIDWVMEKLENDGVAQFEKSFDGLYGNLEQKKKAFLTSTSKSV
jgi:transaldolase